jgi:two-component system nitrate/nitrite response regulator NarL
MELPVTPACEGALQKETNLMPIRVVVIEDHPFVLNAIVEELERQPDIQVVGKARYGSELHRLVRDTSPNVVVLDLRTPDNFEPVDAVQVLRKAHPNVQILVLTGHDDGVWMRELLAAGVLGYVLKSDDLSLSLPEGVRTVHEGRRFYSKTVTNKYIEGEEVAFSARELAILRLAAEGFSSRHIGEELNLAEQTVRNTFPRIYDKLGIKTDRKINPRVAAINKARDLGLLED